ncbi:ABC transporter permease [Ruicaihuangia caeni]|uniref:ABC transporter permease n=1 Tax=Ruicaihuangia caeni TaxID=3042517 RepID=A0AAW6T412_9MICO|nr:ABC transporter permease [Klugiella sp. YN-L-19]MDI2097816.1 ABC transporter permease [Klugiella sp. YN-L-19]
MTLLQWRTRGESQRGRGRPGRGPRGWLPTPGVIAASLFLVVLMAAVLVPSLFSPLDPLRADASASLDAPSAEHWFGTDRAGRDVYARVVHGARASLGVGLGATALALVAGLIIGVVAGLAPKMIDAAVSRSIEVLMAFPEFLLALVVIAVVGPGETGLLVAVASAAMPAYARVARNQTLVVRNAGYVRAATVLGVPPWRSALRHIVPGTLGPLLVMAILGVGTAIVSAAGLSFLGLGPAPPSPEWGVILSEGRNTLSTAWWVAVFPGLAIMAAVVSIGTVGRHLKTGGAVA